MPDNLPELRDIHLPDGVSVFPPAYGWWVVLIMAAALWGGIKLLFFLRQKSKKLFALRLLAKIPTDNPVVAATEMSVILRRICAVKYPEAAALSGKSWIAFLRGKTAAKLSEKTADLLQNAPYIPPSSKNYARKNADDLSVFCRRWIGENL